MLMSGKFFQTTKKDYNDHNRCCNLSNAHYVPGTVYIHYLIYSLQPPYEVDIIHLLFIEEETKSLRG